MAQKILATVFGTIFGFMLCWLDFVRYDTIFEALLLVDFYLWQVFISAVLTATLGLWALKKLGAKTWLTRQPVQWERGSVTRANIWGGILFGMGWAVSGICPGPAVAKAGSGQWIALFVLAGMLIGIGLRDWIEDRAA